MRIIRDDWYDVPTSCVAESIADYVLIFDTRSSTDERLREACLQRCSLKRVKPLTGSVQNTDCAFCGMPVTYVGWGVYRDDNHRVRNGRVKVEYPVCPLCGTPSI